MTVYDYCSLGGCTLAGYHIHGRGFSGAVGTQETINLAFLDFKRKVVYSGVIAVAFYQIFYFNQVSYLLQVADTWLIPCIYL